MERLTKDNDTQYDFVGSYDTNVEEFSNNKELRENVLNKLGQLEDIEEELGIDLITLFKAFKNGIWSKEHMNYPNEHCRQKYPFKDLELFFKDEGVKLMFNHHSYEGGTYIFRDGVFLKDYGKTWALTREELENEN